MTTFTTSKEILAQLEEIRQRNNARLAAEETDRRKAELQELLKPVPPFPEAERTPAAQAERRRRSLEDFWYWERTYFPPELYANYAEPGDFHRELVDLADRHDKKAHVVAGPREFAKTATLKKKFAYDFLHGRRRYMAIGSETLDPASSTIKDILYFLTTNDRILFDYQLEWLEASSDKLYARSVVNPKGTFVDALSEERSARGRQRGFFQRMDYILLTDFENMTSSMTKDAIEARIDRLNEMRTSLAEDGTLIWEGNNFDVDSAMNRLAEESTKGVISEHISVHVYPAWDPARPKRMRSLWPEKYPASTENELIRLCKPMDAHDWAGNFQQRPERRSGQIFPKAHYHEWSELPDDVRSVVWVDPNCSLKNLGDTTAMPCFGFSAKMQRYYITTARCRSYADPNLLIDDLVKLRKGEKDRGVRVLAIGFDGNVAQEAQWTNNVLNYSRLRQVPLPAIEFKRYKVDDLAKNAEVEWKAGKIFFPPGFAETVEGREFVRQVFAFTSKKSKRKDDAPDALISALEFLQELGAITIAGDGPRIISVSKRTITSRF